MYVNDNPSVYSLCLQSNLCSFFFSMKILFTCIISWIFKYLCTFVLIVIKLCLLIYFLINIYWLNSACITYERRQMCKYLYRSQYIIELNKYMYMYPKCICKIQIKIRANNEHSMQASLTVTLLLSANSLRKLITNFICETSAVSMQTSLLLMNVDYISQKYSFSFYCISIWKTFYFLIHIFRLICRYWKQKPTRLFTIFCF